jgi:hypothetical protein
MADLTTDTTTESLISKFWKFAAQCQMLPMMIEPVYNQYKSAFGPKPDEEAVQKFKVLFAEKDGTPKTFSDMLGIGDNDSDDLITKNIADARKEAEKVEKKNRDIFQTILTEKDKDGKPLLDKEYIRYVDRPNRKRIVDAFRKDPPDFSKMKKLYADLAQKAPVGTDYIGSLKNKIKTDIEKEETEWRAKNPEAAKKADAEMEAEKKADAEAAAKKAGRGGGLVVQGTKKPLTERVKPKIKFVTRSQKRKQVVKNILNMVTRKVKNPSPNAPAPATSPVNLQFTPKHQIKEVVGIFN